jgi:hypothetical protein
MQDLCFKSDKFHAVTSKNRVWLERWSWPDGPIRGNMMNCNVDVLRNQYPQTLVDSREYSATTRSPALPGVIVTRHRRTVTSAANEHGPIIIGITLQNRIYHTV